MLGLSLPDAEQISRQEYDLELVKPLRAHIQKLRAKGSKPVILLVYGIPLIIREEAGQEGKASDKTSVAVDSELNLILDYRYPKAV